MQPVLGLTAPVDLSGRTALVIGGTSGIGAAVVRQLAQLGASTIIVGRDPERLQSMRQALTKESLDTRIHTQRADLADLASVRLAAAEVSRTFGRLDIVVANASLLNPSNTRQFTHDGFESTFGVNHLGNAEFLLALQQPILAAHDRVVIVASEAHRRAKGLPLDDLMGDKEFNGMVAYSRSKLANILFAKALAERWRPRGVTVYSAHPGGVRTNMMATATAHHALARIALALFGSQILMPDEAARGIVRIAVDPAEAAPPGAYFEIGRLNQGGDLANDAALSEKIWEITCKLLQRNPDGNPR